MTGRFRPRLAAWPIDPVVRRLKAYAALSDADETLVRALGDRRERHAPGEELIVEGQPARRARFVVAGWAACQRTLPDGRRQIFRLILPGDGVGLHERISPAAPWTVVSLTALETVDAATMVEAAEAGRSPALAQALVGAALSEEQLLLDHLVRLGQQTAYERVAHFLLELQRRLQVTGLGDSRRFPLPLTQEMLADALGLSIVHVNRTLQQLRRERLIELRSGVAILLEPEMLNDIASCEHAPAPRFGASRTQASNTPA